MHDAKSDGEGAGSPRKSLVSALSSLVVEQSVRGRGVRLGFGAGDAGISYLKLNSTDLVAQPTAATGLINC